MSGPKARHTGVVFARVYPPRPLDPPTLEAALVRLASDPTQAPVVFEARSTPHGAGAQVNYWLGTTGEHLRWLRRTLYDLLPGLRMDTSPTTTRTAVVTSAKVKVRPHGLALAVDRPVAIATATLSALNQHLMPGEELVLQVVLGPRRTPRHHRGKLGDPTQPWWTVPVAGVLDAPSPVMRQHDQRALQAGLATRIRLGVNATTSERRGRLLAGLLGGISTAKAPSTFLSLRRDDAGRLNAGAGPWRWDFSPAAAELVGLLAWPLGDAQLPGLPSLHPRLLPTPPKLAAGTAQATRTVGVSSAPGESTRIGLAPADSLFHLITTGPTGSGKSTVMLHLIAADIDDGRPVVVIDPKRQLIDDVVERAIPKERIGDVVLIDPADQLVPGFNPVDVGGRDPDVVVDGLLAVFAAVFADGWGPRTQDITHAGLLTLARVNANNTAGGGSPYTLLDLPRLFTDARFRRSVTGQVAGDPALGSFWAAWEANSPQAQAAALAAPANKWRQYLLRPSVRRIIGQPCPRFRLRDVFGENKVVLVALNEGLIGPITAQLLGGLIVAEIWAATLERAGEREPGKHPASVWVDEVQNYLHLPTALDEALNASRSFGVAWGMANQFRSQMPASMLAAVDSNARNKIVFRPTDPKDATAYARMTADLEPVDFMSLGQYRAYATLVADGEQQPWCSLATLPPLNSTGLGAQIRDASRTIYGGQPPAPPTAEQPPDADSDPPVVGRKRRRPQP